MARTGRPTKLTQRIDDAGTTVAEAIVRRISQTGIAAEAASSVGVNRSTFHGWVREGRRLAIKQLDPDAPRLTAEQRRLADFANAVVEAEDEWHMRTLVRLEQASAGGTVVETVTEQVEALRDADGAVLVDDDGRVRYRTVGRSVKRQTMGPDTAVARWRLERKYPHLYGPQARIEVSVPELAALGEGASPAAALVERLEAIARRKAESDAVLPVIEATSTEVDPDDDDPDEG